jgi:hypothetical protein
MGFFDDIFGVINVVVKTGVSSAVNMVTSIASQPLNPAGAITNAVQKTQQTLQQESTYEAQQKTQRDVKEAATAAKVPTPAPITFPLFQPPTTKVAAAPSAIETLEASKTATQARSSYKLEYAGTTGNWNWDLSSVLPGVKIGIPPNMTPEEWMLQNPSASIVKQVAEAKLKGITTLAGAIPGMPGFAQALGTLNILGVNGSGTFPGKLLLDGTTIKTFGPGNSVTAFTQQVTAGTHTLTLKPDLGVGIDFPITIAAGETKKISNLSMPSPTTATTQLKKALEAGVITAGMYDANGFLTMPIPFTRELYVAMGYSGTGGMFLAERPGVISRSITPNKEELTVYQDQSYEIRDANVFSSSFGGIRESGSPGSYQTAVKPAWVQAGWDTQAQWEAAGRIARNLLEFQIAHGQIPGVTSLEDFFKQISAGAGAGAITTAAGVVQQTVQQAVQNLPSGISQDVIDDLTRQVKSGTGRPGTVIVNGLVRGIYATKDQSLALTLILMAKSQTGVLDQSNGEIVTFYDNAVSIGTAITSNGKASISKALEAGWHKICAKVEAGTQGPAVYTCTPSFQVGGAATTGISAATAAERQALEAATAALQQQQAAIGAPTPTAVTAAGLPEIPGTINIGQLVSDSPLPITITPSDGSPPITVLPNTPDVKIPVTSGKVFLTIVQKGKELVQLPVNVGAGETVPLGVIQLR